ESLAGYAPVGVFDRHGPVGERARVGCGEGPFDGVVDVLQFGCPHIALGGGDVRLVGAVKSEPVRDALTHPIVPLAGVLEGRGVRGDEDVDGGQFTHAVPSRKTVVQSFLMLTTVQPSCAAFASDDSAPLV